LGKIGTNISKYKTYPRIVGETGGKDFIIAHPSANSKQVSTGIARGAFEYQGQNVAASRVISTKFMASCKSRIRSRFKINENGFSRGYEQFYHCCNL
jgi:1-pyrroline-5-carboxylate dehydrogenase